MITFRDPLVRLMMCPMTRRSLIWAGGILIAVAAGLIGYVAGVGLEEGDRLASVIAAITGLAGLGVTLYALQQPPASSGAAPPPEVPAAPPPAAKAADGSRVQLNVPQPGATLYAAQDGTMNIHHHAPPPAPPGAGSPGSESSGGVDGGGSRR
ncbi:hypothetical protein AB0F88_21185 [Streptosporangium sp. NPDC023963]|uniref:hypothetical protein n=1 Tax=Streptosporangium sp. NPDC023963 TaxID=3155608 RepID=UPI00342EF3AA